MTIDTLSPLYREKETLSCERRGDARLSSLYNNSNHNHLSLHTGREDVLLSLHKEEISTREERRSPISYLYRDRGYALLLCRERGGVPLCGREEETLFSPLSGQETLYLLDKEEER
jgi:hypothetical protein